MKIADLLRGVAGVVITVVDKVFDDGRALVQGAVFLPANIKADLTTTLNDAQSDVHDVEHLAGTLLGNAIADGVDDFTSFFMSQAELLAGSGTDLSKLGPGSKTNILQLWNTMKAQGDTLVAQLHAGLNPAAPPPA